MSCSFCTTLDNRHAPGCPAAPPADRAAAARARAERQVALRLRAADDRWAAAVEEAEKRERVLRRLSERESRGRP